MQRGFVMLYVILGLAVLSGGLGLLLRNAYINNGAYEAQLDAADQSLKAKDIVIRGIEAAAEHKEQVLLERQQKIEQLDNDLKRKNYAIRELRKNDPATADWFERCDLPDALYQCLRAQNCDPRPADPVTP